jgi:hypothetical protein
VGADGRRVEDQQIEIRVAQRGEDRVPAAGLGPAVEPPPDGVGLAESLGQVGPGDAGAADVQGGVDEEPIVPGDTAVQPGAAGQQVLDPFPVGVGDRVSRKHRRPSMA